MASCRRATGGEEAQALVELTALNGFSYDTVVDVGSGSRELQAGKDRRCLSCMVQLFIVGVVGAVCVGLAVLFGSDEELCRTLQIGCAPLDFVVVGAGPAGSAVAYHLSDKSIGARVLVLEAGGPSQLATGGADFFYQNMTVFDVPLAWSYVAKLAQYHWDMEGDAILAKVVGGCGVHNAMLYVRAMPANVRAWNMSGWTWADLYEQYLALETYQGAGPTTVWHNMGGPMTTSSPIYKDLLGKKFLETTANMGLPQSRDFNIPDERLGAGYYSFNIRHGVRDSAAAALLIPSLGDESKRLSLSTFTLVEHLALEPDANGSGDMQVTSLLGVDREGKQWRQSIGKHTRVVLTAGAVNTPTLLMKSGIGHREDLLEAGLGEPIVELPTTGHRLQDHPAVGLVFEVTPPLIADMSSVYRRFSNWTEGHILEQYPASFGYPGFSTGAFLHSGLKDDKSAEPAELPDLQLTVFPVMIEPHVMKKRLTITYDHVLVTVAMIDPRTEYDIKLRYPPAADRSTSPHAQRRTSGKAQWPEDGPSHDGRRRRSDASGSSSSGSDKTPAPDVTDDEVAEELMDDDQGLEKPMTWNGDAPYPEVHHDHLDPFDVARLVKGVKIVREIFATSPLNTFVIGEEEPGLDVDSDERIAQWIVDTHTSNSHWCCSAQMGTERRDSVVDANLKVHGVSNLYIADASVFPSIPNGNVHSTVLAVASAFAKRVAKRMTPKRNAN